MNWLLNQIRLRLTLMEFTILVVMFSCLVALAIVAFFMQLYYTYAE
jgi:hypothetical protein